MIVKKEYVVERVSNYEGLVKIIDEINNKHYELVQVIEKEKDGFIVIFIKIKKIF